MKYARDYIGGRGIAAKLAWEFVPPAIDAFDPRNPLILMTGPLTGTLAPTSGRTIFSGVSPRVYPKPWYTHSTMGGLFGSELKYAGFDGLVIVEQSEAPVYLWINDGDINILSADDLWGLTITDTVEKIRARHDLDVQIACIGPAGENLVRYAVISHPPENASGHSGFGAVMGAKKLKAIVIKGTGGVKVAKPPRFVETCRHAMAMARTGPVDSALKVKLEYPVPATTPACAHSCSVNCRLGRVVFNIPRKFSKGDPIKARQTCCVGSLWIRKEPPQDGYEGGGIRVPAINGWEPDEGGAELHLLCDDLGIDHWSLLTLQPWFIRSMELGVENIEGLKLNPRDAGWFYELLHLIAYRDGIGDVLAEDLRRAVDSWQEIIPDELIKLGHALEFAYGFPAHREGRIWDTEPLPFWLVSALMYATESRDPAIGTHSSFLHLAELFLYDQASFLTKLRPIAARLWGSEKAIEPSFEDKTQVTMWCQHRHIILDSLPLCDFSFPRLLKPFKDMRSWTTADDVYGDLDIEANLLSDCTGFDISNFELEKIAERTFNLERMILVKRFDRNRKTDEMVAPHFQLPCKTDGTNISMEKFGELLDHYYKDRGWDPVTGIPLNDKLNQLGLEQSE
jgi:aldehyde:ferredoxin oxidoreductase